MEVINMPGGLQFHYRDLLEFVRGEGEISEPRGQRTREIHDAVLYFHDAAAHMLPLGLGRNLSRSVAAVEALQLIGAVERSELLIRASPAFKKYMEHDLDTGEPTHFHGHYGRRIGLQLLEVISKMAGTDPYTRQAVITLWDPAVDNLKNKHDYPCTIAIGFRRRDHFGEPLLDMRVTMRSNDAWLGLPYDAFQFQQLQWTVANVLDMEPGTYVHHAWSLHLYERDLEKVDGVGDEPLGRSRTEQPRGLFYDNPVGIRDHMLMAQALLDDDAAAQNPDHLSRSQLWYRDALTPLRDRVDEEVSDE